MRIRFTIISKRANSLEDSMYRLIDRTVMGAHHPCSRERIDSVIGGGYHVQGPVKVDGTGWMSSKR